MPRLQPAAGYITAKDAMSILDISDATLHYYVSTGKLRRYGPPERKHKFYKLSEVEALKASRNVFAAEYRPGDWRENPSSSFEIAKAEDIPAIAKIDHDAIHPEDDLYNNEFLLRWQQRNSETLFALRDANGSVVGFASLLPVRYPILDGFIRGEISITDIADEDIPLFISDTAIHLYVVAVGINPKLPAKIRHEYGFALLTGIFSFLLALADRGVTIETITARSHTQDGIRLMRKLGLPWLISPVSSIELFSVRLAESGMPFFRKYCARLEQWKQQQPGATLARYASPPPSQPQPEQVQRLSPQPVPDPTTDIEGPFISLADLAKKLGLPYRSLRKFVLDNGINHTPEPKRNPKGQQVGAYTLYFTSEQERVLREKWNEKHPKRLI